MVMLVGRWAATSPDTPAPTTALLLKSLAPDASQTLKSVKLANSVVVAMKFDSAEGLPDYSGVLVAAILVLWPEGKTEEPAPVVDDAPHDAFAGGYPVPPMPAGGAVRGAAAPLDFTRNRTTVTADAEEDR